MNKKRTGWREDAIVSSVLSLDTIRMAVKLEPKFKYLVNKISSAVEGPSPWG